MREGERGGGGEGGGERGRGGVKGGMKGAQEEEREGVREGAEEKKGRGRRSEGEKVGEFSKTLSQTQHSTILAFLTYSGSARHFVCRECTVNALVISLFFSFPRFVSCLCLCRRWPHLLISASGVSECATVLIVYGE